MRGEDVNNGGWMECGTGGIEVYETSLVSTLDPFDWQPVVLEGLTYEAYPRWSNEKAAS